MADKRDPKPPRQRSRKPEQGAEPDIKRAAPADQVGFPFKPPFIADGVKVVDADRKTAAIAGTEHGLMESRARWATKLAEILNETY